MPSYYTRYEVQASKGGEAFTVGYTSRVSRIGLLRVMQGRGQELIDRCTIAPDDQITFGFQRGARSLAYAEISGWRIGFTGRTELDAQRTPTPTEDR